MKIETAIKWLKRNYDLALKNDYIVNKVGWSLYTTWKEVSEIDLKKKDRKEGDADANSD